MRCYASSPTGAANSAPQTSRLDSGERKGRGKGSRMVKGWKGKGRRKEWEKEGREVEADKWKGGKRRRKERGREEFCAVLIFP